MSSPALSDYDRDVVSPGAPQWLGDRIQRKVAAAATDHIVRLPRAPVIPPPREVLAGPTAPVDLDVPLAEDEHRPRKVRRRSLDPDMLPPPPIDLRHERHTQMVQRWVIAAALVVLGTFVVVALLGGFDRRLRADAPSQGPVSASEPGTNAQEQTLVARPLLRLPAQNRSNLVNQPIPLGMTPLDRSLGGGKHVPGYSVVQSLPPPSCCRVHSDLLSIVNFRNVAVTPCYT